MIVYAFVILLIVLFRYRLDNNFIGRPDYYKETKSMRIICAIFVILAAIRGREVGADTISYIATYNSDIEMSLGQVIQKHGSIGGGYFFIMKIFSMTGLSVHWWFAVVELLYISSIFQFIQRYSKDKLMSLLCFFTMGLYSFSLAGLKQTLSMAFVLFAFLALIDKRYMAATLLGVLSFWCHSAASIFAFGLVFYFIRNSRMYYFYLILFSVIILLSGDSVWVNSINLLEDEHYSELYTETDSLYNANTFIFYILCLFIIAFSWRRYASDNPDECRILSGMTLVAISFQSLATSFSTAFRVAYFFLPFMIVLIPNSCNYFGNDNSKKVLKIGICILCIFWCLYTGRNNQFTFFWND